jgi:membrane protein
VTAPCAPPRRGATAQAAAIVRLAARAWLDDRAPEMGAALAYYTLFSLAPLLLIVVAIAGWAFGADAARGEVALQLRGLLGDAGAQAVQALLHDARRPAGGLLSAALGLALMLLGATTVFAELQHALDQIWRVPPPRRRGLVALLRTRLRAFLLVLALGVLLVLSLALGALFDAGRRRLPGLASAAAAWVPPLLTFAVMSATCALVYKLMPRARIAWRDVLVGAVVTALLLTLAREAIALYIAYSAVASAFGAAGALVAVMVWVYLSAQVFLLGAELTWAYAYTAGSRRGETIPPRPVPHG